MTDAPPKFYLQWNGPNWITVGLMAFVSIVVVGFIASGVRAYRGISNDGNQG